MAADSVYVLAKRLEGDIARILSAVDTHDLSSGIKTAVQTLKRDIATARIGARDYELAETSDEQRNYGREAREAFDAAEQGILALSQYNIFSAIEVAELSARTSMICQELV